MNAAEFANRRRHILSDLPESKVDCFIVSGLANVRYLSGFTGSNALLLLAAGTATLYTDPRYEIQASGESDCRVQVVKGLLHAAAMKQVKRKGWKRIGFEPGRIAYGSFAELQSQLPAGASLVPTAYLVERRRMVKSQAEIDLIKRSVLTNSAAYEKAISRLKSTMKESDLAAEIEYQMRRLGAEKPSFETLVASGPRTALPHAQPTSNRLMNNQLILIDMGALQSGYCSDMTRMLHLGAPSPKSKKLYRAVLEAQRAAIDSVRENTTAAAVDRKARAVLKSYGFEKYFVHSTGHGLGLEIHEPPRLGKRDKTRLQAGMVVTIEPGAYIQGFGGVRIEDTILVTTNGCEILTPTSKELRIV